MAFCSHVHGMNHDITPSYGGVKIDQTLTRDDMAAPASAVGAIKKRLDGIEDAVDAAAAYANTAASSANTAALEADKAAKRVDASIDSANAAASAAVAATENAYSKANAATEAAGNANAAAANVNAKAAIAEKAAESANTAADNAKAAAASALSAAENVNVPIAGANSAAQNAESAAKAANAAAENANNAAASASVSAASADAAAQTADEAGRNANAGAKDAVSAAQQASTAAQRANEAAEKAESYESIESARASAEAARENAERERIEAETARASAELQRAETFAGYQEEIGSLKGDLNILNNETMGYTHDIPAKYYKIAFDEVWRSKSGNVSPSAAVSEVTLLESNGNTQTMISAIADSEYESTYAASKVIDGDLTTMWSSKDANGIIHELIIELDSPVIIKQLGIVPRTDISLGVPNKMTIYASIDGTCWIEIAHFDDLKDGWAEKTWRYFDLNCLTEQTRPVREEVNECKRKLGEMFVSDDYFAYYVFGELQKIEMNWSFTRGETGALQCDHPDAPDFTVYGAPAFNDKGVSAHSSRAKDYIQLDMNFLRGKNWEMDICTADYACETETIQNYDVPISLLAEGTDSPCWIYKPSTDVGDNGYVMHQFSMNKFGGYQVEFSYSILNRRFKFIRSSDKGTLRCLLMQIDADGNETVTADRTLTTDVEPDALRLCNDATIMKGCMLPISSLTIIYYDVPKGE